MGQKMTELPITLGLFSPGSPPGEGPLRAGMRWLDSKGFRLLEGSTARAGAGLHAGDPEFRAADLHALLEDPRVDAVLCTRGGTGTAGVLPYIDPDRIRRLRKPIIGLSDVTALHLALYKAGGICGIAAPVLVQLSDEAPEYTRASWLAMVRGETGPGPLRWLDALGPEASTPESAGEEPSHPRNGSAEGPLMPCNLSLLTCLIGTPFLPNLDGAILLLEEIEETPQSLDRMVTQLSLSGVCSQLGGLILGQFARCVPRNSSVTEEDGRRAVHEWAWSLNVPFIDDFPHGHDPVCCSLPFGTTVRMTGNPPGLELLEQPPASHRILVRPDRSCGSA